MNLIEAYKEAKVGDWIKLPGKMQTQKHDDGGKKIRDMIRDGINVEMLFSDDWQIERKPLVWEGEVEWATHDYAVYPYQIDMSDKGFNFVSLVGKRTKIRIEEIIE